MSAKGMSESPLAVTWAVCPEEIFLLGKVLSTVARRYWDGRREDVRETPMTFRAVSSRGLRAGMQAVRTASSSSMMVQVEREMPTAHVSTLGLFQSLSLIVFTPDEKEATRPMPISTPMAMRARGGRFSLRKKTMGARESKISVAMLMPAPVLVTDVSVEV